MISKKHLFYAFSPELEPVITINPGEMIVIETVDAFGGQLKSKHDTLDGLNWDKVNPATGPLFINGAKKGDFLKVVINNIEMDTIGVMASIPNAGIFGHLYETSTLKFFDIKSDTTDFNDFVIPLTPMIGVIGVAPETGKISNGIPDAHGGNMDNRLITTGTVLYLPVQTEGALFGLGDLHACMGDGEVNVTGIEVGGKVTVTFDIIKNASNNQPLMTKDGFFYTLYSAESLDDAVEGAAFQMHYWIKKALQYSDSDAAMLLSLMGHAEICQVVDPKKTSRFKMPQKYFNHLDL